MKGIKNLSQSCVGGAYTALEWFTLRKYNVANADYVEEMQVMFWAIL